MAIDIRVNYTDTDAVGRAFGTEGLVKAMDRYKIEAAVLTSRLAVECDFRRGNEELHQVLKGDERLYGYFVANPNYPGETVEMMRERMNSPKFLAAALYFGSTKPYPNAEDFDEILNGFRRFGKPGFIHTTDQQSVDAAEEIAQAFPGIQFILGGMGGADWKRAVNAADRRVNIFLETSGSYDAEKIAYAVEKVGAHRILFGSDQPFADPAAMLALIKSSGISEESMAKIAGQNARSVFEEMGNKG
ncbi:MAG: amidohydrolase family protein [Armatimonadetes bacterium]|nr:amidohydrolase family protein [Armatimonadota bacterium]